MVKATCKLIFLDGKYVTATIEASTPEGNYPVKYEGSIDKITPSFSESLTGLTYLFKSLARQTDAKLEIIKEGEFDSWTE